MKPQPIGDHVKQGDIVGYVDVEKPVELSPSQGGRWYVLQVEPNREQTVMTNLIIRRVSCYMPTFLKPAKISARAHAAGCEHPDVQRPLFPGVLFVAENVVAAKDRLIRSVAGVSARPYMRFGDDLAIVSPEAMQVIQYIEAGERELYYRTPRAGTRGAPIVVNVGDIVRITAQAALQGYNGTIADVDDEGRITLLIEIMKRKVRVKMTTDQVEAV
ncbi:MAG: transcription termination/antitermination NusG family protein [Pseudomonadota bacterium]